MAIVIKKTDKMLFGLFCSFSRCTNFSYKCTAELKHAPKLDGELLQVVVLTRHGCRAPFDYYGNYTPSGWNCESTDGPSPRMSSSNTKKFRRYHTVYDSDMLLYPPSCKKADLTVEGQNMHTNLGKFYRKYLIDEENFLPDNLNPDFVQFRASEPERTVRSAESFIHGLYPPDHPDEILTIQTGTDLLELLHPRAGHCKDLTDVWNQWITSEEYLTKQKAAEPTLRKLVEDSGYEWDENQWLYVGDWLYTIGCCGSGEIPDFITQEQLDVAMDAVEFFTLKFFSMKRGVAGASIIREILMQIERAATGTTNTRFVLMSAHDVSIVSALDLLGVHLDYIPPFASHLAFEVWKINERLHVRVVLNGDVMLGPITLTKFKAIAGPYLSYCPELGDYF